MDDLELMPRSVRDKLDRVGIKLHLREWALLTRDERRWLVIQPCASEAEAARYAAELDVLVRRHTGRPPERLPSRAGR